MASVEEQVEYRYKQYLEGLGIRLFYKTDSMGDVVDTALETGASKSGGSGRNYPDIRFWADLGGGRAVPVMVEAKGVRGKLEKLDASGSVARESAWTSDSKPGARNPHKKGDMNWSVVEGYATNGAVHYARCVLENSGDAYDMALAIGVNGFLQDGELVCEHKTYLLSKGLGNIPQYLERLSGCGLKTLDGSLELFRHGCESELRVYVESAHLSKEEKENAKKKLEAELEASVKRIHQRLYDAEDLRNILSTNEKLYLFCALIMAGLPAYGDKGMSEDLLRGIEFDKRNDGTVVLDRVQEFLESRGNGEAKVNSIVNLFRPTLTRKNVWRVQPTSRESLIKTLYRQVKSEVVPYLTTKLRLDFTGRILNSLNDWVHIENDRANDVVLTPRFVCQMMARLCRTDRDSYVWDSAMGSAGMLVAALDIMESEVWDDERLTEAQKKAKISDIHTKQLLGVEILGNIYVLAVLNMILMGDGSSNVKNKDSFEYLNDEGLPDDFPANVFLLNPPYSQAGKGLNFVAKAVEIMDKGYACVLIQENAGSGNGGEYAKQILQRATLRASIHMPIDLFHGKSSVQTAVYLFECARPHQVDDMVTFIDMSEDGYARQNRKKSSSDVNLRDDGTAQARYAEVVARVLDKRPESDYYTEANGKLIRDSITLEGNDWTFAQHKKVDLRPTDDDFRKVVADYLAWRVSQVICSV